MKYTPQWKWLNEEFTKVDREKTPWLIVLMHSPMYNSNDAHFMEGESMRVAFESWFCQYKVDIVFAGHVHAYERSVRLLLGFFPLRLESFMHRLNIVENSIWFETDSVPHHAILGIVFNNVQPIHE